MFSKIISALKASLTCTSLNTRALSNDLYDFIRCISLGAITKEELDTATFLSRNLSDEIILMFVFIDSPKDGRIKADCALRNDKKYIVIYRYTGDTEDDSAIIDMLYRECVRILIYALNFDYSRFTVSTNFHRLSSVAKLEMLAPYIIVCKVLDDIIDSNFHITGESIMLSALNKSNIPQVEKEIKFILREKPDENTLFNLNGFLLPFVKED